MVRTNVERIYRVLSLQKFRVFRPTYSSIFRSDVFIDSDSSQCMKRHVKPRRGHAITSHTDPFNADTHAETGPAQPQRLAATGDRGRGRQRAGQGAGPCIIAEQAN